MVWRLTFIDSFVKCQTRTQIHAHDQMMYMLPVTRGHKNHFANEAI